MTFEQIKMAAEKLTFMNTKTFNTKSEQYKPTLPLPRKLNPRTRRIAFVKKVSEVESVSEYLFKERNIHPSTVGERCFDIQLKEARK